jgi:hypothetical protein
MLVGAMRLLSSRARVAETFLTTGSTRFDLILGPLRIDYLYAHLPTTTLIRMLQWLMCYG